MERMTERVCARCGSTFNKPPQITYAVFDGRRFCGKLCAARASGDKRRFRDKPGFKRDRSKEKPWRVLALQPNSRLSHLCAKAKTRAKKLGVPFGIDTQYLISLWAKGGGRCCLTGRAFDLTPWGGHFQTGPDSLSIDRIVPSLGYVRGNVRLIITHMNFALSHYGEDAFRKLVADYLGFGRDSDWG